MGMMSTSDSKSYHHGDLRQALLETTRQMIAEEGVEGVTMRGLAQRIGVSRTAPYRHFENKAALLAAVAQEGFEELIKHLRCARTADPTLSPIIRFEKMGMSYVQFAIAQPTAYRLMYGADAVRAEDHPKVREVVRRTLDELIEMIQECKAAGFLKTYHPRDVGMTVWSACHGLSLLLIDQHLQIDNVDQLIERVTRIVRVGLEGER